MTVNHVYKNELLVHTNTCVLFTIYYIWHKYLRYARNIYSEILK